MNFKHLLIVLILFIGTNTFAQDDPAPSYLTEQEFPDSVRNLQMLALDGEEISFDDLLEKHKGKKIVIDFWASWCRDCIVGLPKLNEMMKKTKNKKVVYVFLSLDENEVRWKSAIKRNGMKGEHYRIEIGWKNVLSNYIGLDWIPRYIILDEEGNIILPKAITASDKAFKKALKK